MIKRYLDILFCLSLLSLVSSCEDDLLYKEENIIDGITTVSATVDFHPLLTTAVGQQSRGESGTLMSSLTNLTIFLYDQEDNIYDIIPQSELSDLVIKVPGEDGANYDMPDDAGGIDNKAEESTARATFTLKNIKSGKYRMFCVANMGVISDTPENREKFSHSSKLRDTQVKWNETEIGSNDQMFGYFTADKTDDANASAGFESSSPLIIDYSHNVLHAWLKRAASKVTLVYDGSGLNPDIYIYINKVTIKDIPRYCKIGNNNKLESTEPEYMISTGDCIYYNSDGPTTEQGSGTDYNNWLTITNDTPKVGAVKEVDGDIITHPEEAEALYFYENMQGNFSDAVNKKYYSKEPDWDYVGWVPEKGQYDYKDNVPYGTYIEVEAYYDSQNSAQLSSGKIIYRYMLGQDDYYDYNAIRNHHYKLTLGFKYWANQPDWHIEYIEPEKTFYNDPSYYVSYSYNTRSEFPVRFTTAPEEFEVEIVENNWGPYDPMGSYEAPKEEVGTGTFAFKWNRTVYDNKLSATSPVGSGSYYYGLQKPFDTTGDSRLSSIPPEQPQLVTPIWAGFLALMVPPNGNDAVILPGSGSSSYNANSVSKLKNYFYGKGDGNTIPQNIRKFTQADLTFPGWEAGKSMVKKLAEGTNNECEISKAPDGSVTIKLPMWTRPKSMLGISGFTGTNPYEYYQRKATVRLTAKYTGNQSTTKYLPVFQARRILNPKGVWRGHGEDGSFDVRLYQLESPTATEYSPVESAGAWRAYVKPVTEGSSDFISLSGGMGEDASMPGAILGNTDSEVEFTINFNGATSAGNTRCAIVEIQYNGFTCIHNIFVRQGYEEPIKVVSSSSTEWTSFNLYKTNLTTHSTTYLQWDPNTKNYIDAEICKSPLALTTLFKRANYAEGIWTSNNTNSNLGPLDPPGSTNMALTNGGSKNWAQIDGYTVSTPGTQNLPASNDPRITFTWGRFVQNIGGKAQHFRLPTYDDFKALQDYADFGIGVLYADGATGSSKSIEVAHGFTDKDNDGIQDGQSSVEKGGPSGMRGFIVYNSANANQIFFPIGADGIGRRTVQEASGNSLGILRYSSVATVLTASSTTHNNAYRPIPYNMPPVQGGIYWLEKVSIVGNDYFPGWDMNYFDMNFNAYDYACCYKTNGDALPIRLVKDENP